MLFAFSANQTKWENVGIGIPLFHLFDALPLHLTIRMMKYLNGGEKGKNGTLLQFLM